MILLLVVYDLIAVWTEFSLIAAEKSLFCVIIPSGLLVLWYQTKTACNVGANLQSSLSYKWGSISI